MRPRKGANLVHTILIISSRKGTYELQNIFLIRGSVSIFPRNLFKKRGWNESGSRGVNPYTFTVGKTRGLRPETVYRKHSENNW